MPFLAQEPCVGHAGSSTDPSASCCSGYTKWNYDANAGTPYTGFMCWTASCADQGQFANPGVGGPGCCPPLVNVDGKCSVAPINNPPPSTTTPPSGSGGGGFFDSLGLDSTTLMMLGGGLLLLLVMSGGKKK